MIGCVQYVREAMYAHQGRYVLITDLGEVTEARVLEVRSAGGEVARG